MTPLPRPVAAPARARAALAAAVAATTLAATALAATTLAIAPAWAGPPPAAPGTAERVTLLTGDVVELSEAAPERYAMTVEPAPGRELVTFHTVEVDGGLLVLPSDVVPYLGTAVLDERLFDVPRLVAQGYSDAAAPRLPLIVRYEDPVPGVLGEELAGLELAATSLASVGGAALSPAKRDLAELWQAVSTPAPQAAQFGGGIAEIWLDGPVAPALEHSVPQVGAPELWDAGFDGTGVSIAVLDTGVDDEHPDLAGGVGEHRNFTDSPGTEDVFGHGTHVAAIAAGTGARPGVAPGATVLSGKVLNDEGMGFESWIIEGMEWAVAAGATVVNLSLGGEPTDGTDPLSQAVDRLSAETGALFVVSAGNSGGDYQVGTPGSASAALTVGAVDAEDELASFSSRGPRLGDNAVKPEITAPGVEVVAARAAGTSLGRPVDPHYTAVSGTSMAAPHVAGAAALLAQANQQWDGPTLKDALVSTAAVHPELTVFEQGGGRLDVARAAAQQVYATGTVDFGTHSQPPAGDPGPPPAPVTVELTYTNHTDGPVTLALAAELTNLDRSVPAGGAVSFDAGDQVTVPARGELGVSATLDLSALERGRHGGWITATGPDGVVARTAVAATLQGPKHPVTFRAQAADGGPAAVDMLAIHGDDPRNDVIWWVNYGGSYTVELEEGTYLLQGLVDAHDPQVPELTLVTDPELVVAGEREVLLDAATATPVRIETPQPAEQRGVFSFYVHRELGNGRTISHGVLSFHDIRQLNVTPTAPVTSGEYEFSARWALQAPLASGLIPGQPEPLELHLSNQAPAHDQQLELPLVYVGTGSPKELAQLDLTGAAALVVEQTQGLIPEQLVALAQAGAAAALIVPEPEHRPFTVWRPIGDRDPIPGMVTGHASGARLIEYATTNPDQARIELSLTIASPYLYDVLHVESGWVPAEIRHEVTAGNSARMAVSYADLGQPGELGWAKEQRFGWREWQQYAWNDRQRIVPLGTTREEWVSAGDTLWQHRAHHMYTWDDMGELRGGMVSSPGTSQPGQDTEVSFHGPVIRPAAPLGVPYLVSTRTEDRLELRVPEFVDSSHHHGFAAPHEVSARLLRDGALVEELPDAWRDVFTVAETATYRLELSTQRRDESWQWATATETAWEFASQRAADPSTPAPLPLLQLDYHVPADLSGTVARGRPHLLTVGVRHQDGLEAPRVRAASVEVSFDEGQRWRPVPTNQVGPRLHVMVPAGGAPHHGSVSLRIHVEASDGSTITQTVIRAYGLR